MDVTPANVPISMVSMAEPDFERFPRYREALAAALVAELEPGDAIYIPYLWWHGVESLGSFNVLMNYWWHRDAACRGHPHVAFLHLAYSLFRGMPPEQRKSWRALYDHYVFQTGGDPTEALAPAHRYEGRAMTAGTARKTQGCAARFACRMSAPELRKVDVHGRRIAYRRRDGRSPTILFLPGYGSDMEGTKALALDAFAERRGLGMLRFDYSGTGSSGGEFEQGTLALWLEEALAVIDRLTEGPSCWSDRRWAAGSLSIARFGGRNASQRWSASPQRPISPTGASPKLCGSLARAWPPRRTSADGPPVMTRASGNPGRTCCCSAAPLRSICPVRLLHGDADKDVPLDVAFRTMARLRSADVQLTVIKGGSHRLSEPHQLGAILEPSPR